MKCIVCNKKEALIIMCEDCHNDYFKPIKNELKKITKFPKTYK